MIYEIYTMTFFGVTLELKYINCDAIYVPCHQYAALLDVYLFAKPNHTLNQLLSQGFRALGTPQQDLIEFDSFGNNLCVCLWCDFDLFELILTHVIDALGQVTLENQRALKRMTYVLYPLNCLINQDVNKLRQIKLIFDQEIKKHFNRYLKDRDQHRVITYIV